MSEIQKRRLKDLDYAKELSQRMLFKWDNSEYASEQVKKLTRYSEFNSALIKSVKNILYELVIPELYNKYNKILQNNISDDLLFIKGIYTKYNLRCDLYLRYLSKFDLTDDGNHHVLLKSIFEDEDTDKYMVVLDNIEHTLCHLLLFLDNFHEIDLNETPNYELTNAQIKILQSLNIRYRFGYKRLINNNIEFCEDTKDKFWFNADLLEDVKLILD